MSLLTEIMVFFEILSFKEKIGNSPRKMELYPKNEFL